MTKQDSFSKRVVVFPARTEPAWKTALLVGIVGLAAYLSAAAGEDLLWAVFAIAVLGVAVAPYFVPTEYTLKDDGVLIRRPWGSRFVRFANFQGVRSSETGVWLLPNKRPGVLDSFRQLYIPISDRTLARQWAEFLKEKIEA